MIIYCVEITKYIDNKYDRNYTKSGYFKIKKMRINMVRMDYKTLDEDLNNDVIWDILFVSSDVIFKFNEIILLLIFVLTVVIFLYLMN